MPGGGGQVGKVLRRGLSTAGHEVLVLSRSAEDPGLRWDGRTLGPWQETIDGCDVVINLAGRRVHCRNGDPYLPEMMTSRTLSTRVIGWAIAAAQSPPKLWLQASTATIYAHRMDAPNDDLTGRLAGEEPDVPPAWNARVEIGKAWERELDLARTPNTRKVAMRSAITLSPDKGGAFDIMAKLARRGLLGTAGSGKQFVSWIHEFDFVRSVDFLIDHDEISGPVNLAAPDPRPNKEFNRILREALHAHIGIPAKGLVLELGGYLADGDSELVLKSRYVMPTRLLNAGFTFEYPRWELAAKELSDRWSAQRGSFWKRLTGRGPALTTKP